MRPCARLPAASLAPPLRPTGILLYPAVQQSEWGAEWTKRTDRLDRWPWRQRSLLARRPPLLRRSRAGENRHRHLPGERADLRRRGQGLFPRRRPRARAGALRFRRADRRGGSVGNIDFGSAGLNAAFFTLAHQGILKI